MANLFTKVMAMFRKTEKEAQHIHTHDPYEGDEGIDDPIA